jgi:hypothetical protein
VQEILYAGGERKVSKLYNLKILKSSKVNYYANMNRIVELNVEPDGTGLTVSLAERFIAK